MTPENQRDEDLKKAKENLYRKLTELRLDNPKFGEPLEELVDVTLTAQRKSWEREKKEIIAELLDWKKVHGDTLVMYSVVRKEKQALEAEKKGLEERVWEYKNEWESALYREQGLKAENESLKNKDFVAEAVKQVEASDSMYRQQCLVIRQKSEAIDSLTHALAEARERIKQLEDSLDVALKSGEVYKKEATNFAEKERDASNLLGIFKKSQIDFEKKIQDLNSLVSFMHSLIKFIHNDGKGREVFPNCELFSALEDLLNDPTSIRASEEMKALRKVVEAGKNMMKADPSVLNDKLGSAYAIKHYCEMFEALEALDAKGEKA